MCGRYALYADPEAVARQFGAAPPGFAPRYNVCPGSEVLAITGQPPRATWRTWGMGGGKLANARGETVAQKPMFAAAFRGWRCLVPASGFYEWARRAGRKQPYYLRPKDAPLFALAGIVLLWKGERGISLVTTAPNELVASLHDRMPVIVAPEDYGAWLGGDSREAQALVRPYPSARMVAYPVGLRVNRAGHDEPALIEPLAQPA